MNLVGFTFEPKKIIDEENTIFPVILGMIWQFAGGFDLFITD